MALRLAQVTEDQDWAEVLDLLHRTFAGMEGRIAPPSSLHRMTSETLAQTARTEIALAGHLDGELVLFALLSPRGDTLYLGKIAVSMAHQGQGHARALIAKAAKIAKRMGLSALELQTRIELIENHRTFAALGFVKTGETAHPGYDRPTSITMRKAL